MSQVIDISPNKEGDLLKEIVKEGTGEIPPSGTFVDIHYTGKLDDGTEFDSSRKRNGIFNFKLGVGQVIKGLDLCVTTMSKGEHAILICDPKYAYGNVGCGKAIPPNSRLTFHIELVGWTAEDLSPEKDKSILKTAIKIGEGNTYPTEGLYVYIHLVGIYEGREFENRDVTFNLGEGDECNVVLGVERALRSFRKGEISRLTIMSNYAFGYKGNSELGIPPHATVDYIVTLLNFEKTLDSWYIHIKEQIVQGKIFKEKGTKYFKANKFELAIRMYQKIIDFFNSSFEIKDESDEEEIKALQLAAYLNLSLCYLKLGEYFQSRSSAAEALTIDNNNEKAFFRRGQAQLKLGETQLAANDFKECLKINPNNKAAEAQLNICGNTLKHQLKKEKTLYANMFDKFAKMDIQREEFEKKKEPNVMSSVGEWGKEDREREPSEFEKENPNILLLNGTGEFKDM